MKKLPIHLNRRDPERWSKQLEALPRLATEAVAESFEGGDQHAYYDLLIGAVTRDPLIPEATKTKLCARLIEAQWGGERAKLAAAVYSEIMKHKKKTEGAKRAAEKFGFSEKKARYLYDEHTNRWPDCKRLDARFNEGKQKK